MTTQREREWNSRMQIMLAPKGVGRYDNDERRSGRTFRQVTRCLLHASSYPEQRVLSMNTSRGAADLAFRMAVDAVRSIDAAIDSQHKRITFENGSYVEFRSVDQEPSRFAGMRWDGIAKDF